MANSKTKRTKIIFRIGEIIAHCQCGCGQPIIFKKSHKYNGIPLYLLGHNSKGRKLSKETKSKIGIANKGKKRSEEVKQKLSKVHKGYKYPPDRIGYWKGKLFSEGHKRKMSESLKGRMVSDETKLRISKGETGTKNGPAWNKGISPTREQIRKCLRRRIPSNLEEKFQSIINKYELPYKFVGNGSFIIGGYNPDFINTNNEKIAVEVYARYFKLRNNKTIEEWKKERTNIFKEYGWKVLFFNEIEVNDSHILEVLNKL